MTSSEFYKRHTQVNEPKSETLASPAELPKKIGDYKIESLLNKGGMSLLYLGLHPQTREPIAVKVLSSKYLSHPEMVERFLKEAEIIEMTNHPNIIKLYGHGRWEGGVFIAMEFVQGISLRQMILQEGMTLKRSLGVALQIAHALAHLHTHGIIHRDLKPENILLTAQGGVKVIDFGISQLYTEKLDPSKKQVIGTPVYMSPEQKKDPLNISFSADIYALGIITYELALGRLSHGVVHLSVVPRGLQRILSKALQPDPKNRYEDIIDFIQAVNDYLASDEIKKDMRGSDYLGELSEKLKEAQAVLVPKKLPKWPRVEMALASNCNSAVSSVYYDFFQQKDGIYNIVMGESLRTGVEALLQIAMLKGMVRALRGIDSPTAFVATLNERIMEAAGEEIFSFAFLTLNPMIESFSYVSCGYTPVWYIPAGAESPRRLTADNPPLGSQHAMDIIEVDANFAIGDTLILHTFQAGSAKHTEEIEQDEAQFLEALMENLFLSPQKQVEAIFRKVSHERRAALHERPVTVIGVERIS
jgi:serine/threonine protein kinase